MNAKQQNLILKLARGNQGALQVVLALGQEYGVEMIEALDTMGIRGTDIWLLYKDECGQLLSAMAYKIDNGTQTEQH